MSSTFSCLSMGSQLGLSAEISTGVFFMCLLGLPHGGLLVAQMVKNPLAIQETWVQSLGQEDSLEKEKEIHSCVLAWRMNPTHRRACELQSMGSQRAGHNLIIKEQQQQRS